jgi:hypothetical protein
MDKDDYLKIILLFSVFGMLFSGYLSWGEHFPGVSSTFSCAVASTKIVGVPTCVYGFIMYLIIGVLSGLALKSKK